MALDQLPQRMFQLKLSLLQWVNGGIGGSTIFHVDFTTAAAAADDDADDIIEWCESDDFLDADVPVAAD